MAISFPKTPDRLAFLLRPRALDLLFELLLGVDLFNMTRRLEARDLDDLDDLEDLVDLDFTDFLAPPLGRLEPPPQAPPQTSGSAKHAIDKTNKKIKVFRRMFTSQLLFLASHPESQGIEPTRFRIGRRSNHAYYMPAFDESQPILSTINSLVVHRLACHRFPHLAAPADTPQDSPQPDLPEERRMLE